MQAIDRQTLTPHELVVVDSSVGDGIAQVIHDRAPATEIPIRRTTDHLFSNASSAFRRELALRFPFDETLVEVEDYDWARKVQGEGYAIAYAGDSEVFHSHPSSTLRTVWRMFYYLYLRMRADARVNSR